MDAVINYLLANGVTVVINPTSVITWACLGYLFSCLKQINNSLSELAKNLAVTNTKLQALEKLQDTIHNDNVTIMRRRKSD